ncbi:Hypothetical predicted protein [Cloeon dipterum]|uniref:GTP-binding protein Di-Ras2 n=1 Tax=Cloeon dipterum TaxID=197152 RepID=A0A8S1E2V1_9INSE|nr:Hypothetical predicted protein [Cloeon dipterum]
MADHGERIRLVILGGAGVGKSCIIKRFLFSTYCDRYKSTVEDLYYREYDLGSVTLKVDMLDTSGDLQFPAMRRLCIATAHAFLLVYSVTCPASLESAKRCLDEVREQRADFQEIPIVLAGNKIDMPAVHREVRMDDVTNWLYCEMPKLRVKVMECSAKEDRNIKEVFRSYLTLSKIIPATEGGESSAAGASGGSGGGGGLKRRSSAYVSNKGNRRSVSPAVGAGEEAAGGSSSSLEPTGFSRFKPRSRSLIRRSSRKAKQQMRDANDDCHVS